jgi:hypothetical protein
MVCTEEKCRNWLMLFSGLRPWGFCVKLGKGFPSENERLRNRHSEMYLD